MRVFDLRFTNFISDFDNPKEPTHHILKINTQISSKYLEYSKNLFWCDLNMESDGLCYCGLNPKNITNLQDHIGYLSKLYHKE